MKSLLGRCSLVLVLSTFVVACSSEDSNPTPPSTDAVKESQVSTPDPTNSAEQVGKNENPAPNPEPAVVTEPAPAPEPATEPSPAKDLFLPKLVNWIDSVFNQFKKRDLTPLVDAVKKDVYYFSSVSGYESHLVYKVKASSTGTFFELIYSLDFSGNIVGSVLIEVDATGKKLWSYSSINSQHFIQDFDLTSAGLPVVVKAVEDDHLRVLTWKSKKEKPSSWILKDGKQEGAIAYDPIDGVEAPIEWIDKKGQFILRANHSRVLGQARIVANPNSIYVSAVGSVGEKIFALDLSGNEKWQALVFPPTTIRSGNRKFFRKSPAAPKILVKKDRVFAQTAIHVKEMGVLDPSLSLEEWNEEGTSNEGAVIQAWNLKGKRVFSKLLSDKTDLELSSIVPTENGILAYTKTPELINQRRKFSDDLKEIEMTQLDAEWFNLKDLKSLANGNLLLAGDCFEKVEDSKSSIVGKGCLIQLDSEGKIVNRKEIEGAIGFQAGFESIDVASNGKILIGGSLASRSTYFGLFGVLHTYQAESGPFVEPVSTTGWFWGWF